jgi:hypothetical protein
MGRKPGCQVVASVDRPWNSTSDVPAKDGPRKLVQIIDHTLPEVADLIDNLDPRNTTVKNLLCLLLVKGIVNLVEDPVEMIALVTEGGVGVQENALHIVCHDLADVCQGFGFVEEPDSSDASLVDLSTIDVGATFQS